MKKVKTAIGCLAVGIVGLGILDLGLWITDHVELAVAVIGMVLALVSFAVGNVWAAALMKSGADLTIRSQESDDQRDIAQIRATTDLVKVLMRQSPQPALPMPQQPQLNWLPPLSEFSEGEYSAVEERS